MKDSRAVHPEIRIDIRRGTSRLLIVMLLLAAASACDSVSEKGALNTGDPGEQEEIEEGWLIPPGEIVDGGPGKDGIPSVDRPVFAPVRDIRFVQDDRLVVGVRINDVVRAYPHQVLDWHEIVNDRIDDTAFAVTYCPLTGTGSTWNRQINGQVTEFGVSGLLFRNNLIPYDRQTDTIWSQMLLRAVNGSRLGTAVETLQTIETTWATWKRMYPDAEVLTGNTGFSRSYGGFAYGRDYSTDDGQIFFPRRHVDDRLPNKERVHGIIDGPLEDGQPVARAYVISRFGDGVNLIEDRVGARDYLIVGSSDLNFAAAFERTLSDGSRPEFEPVRNALPIVLQDAEGNRWDVFGVAVEGPRAGERMTPARSYTGYWFGWADFYPGLEIHE